MDSAFSEEAPQGRASEPKKRRRISAKHLRPVLESPYDPAPFVKLEAPARVADLLPSRMPGVVTFSKDEWLASSPAIRQAARHHPTYSIVLGGASQPQRKGAHNVIRRYEVLKAWADTTWDTDPDLVDRCILYGRARNRSRPALKHHTKSPVYPALPAGLAEMYEAPGCTLDDVYAMGEYQTTRVFDMAGCEAWVMPFSTLESLSGHIITYSNGVLEIEQPAEDEADVPVLDSVEGGVETSV